MAKKLNLNCSQKSFIDMDQGQSFKQKKALIDKYIHVMMIPRLIVQRTNM